MSTFVAVQAVAVALLGGAVVQAHGVSAGNGSVIDWRTVKSGAALQEGGDAFDTAQLFVSLVGTEVAVAAVDHEAALDLPPSPKAAPCITAFSQQANGGRRRQFEVGGFSVLVEPHTDDASQAAFTERLAALASTLG